VAATKKTKKKTTAAVETAKPALVPIPKTKPKVTLVLQNGDAWNGRPMTKQIVSEGSTLLLVGFGALWRSTSGAKMTFKAITKSEVTSPTRYYVDDSLVVDGADLWVAGYPGVMRSKDGGKTWKKVGFPGKGPPPKLHAICRDAASGAIWVGGEEGLIAVCRDGKSFEVVAGADGQQIQTLYATPWGVIATTWSGRVFVSDGDGGGDGDSMRQLTVNGRGPVTGVSVTPRGTLVIVGYGNYKGCIFRSEDGGKTFRPGKSTAGTRLHCLAALPDGRLIAGGDNDQLAISYDDGVSIEPLVHKEKTENGTEFKTACTHDDRVFITGATQNIVAVA